MNCAICNKPSVGYALNMANTAGWCSRDCHAVAVRTNHESEDYLRWLHKPEYRMEADRLAVMARNERVAKALAERRTQ